MKNLRPLFVTIAFFGFAVAVGSEALATLQQQRDQILVAIQVNVTPAVAYIPGSRPSRIDSRMALRARGSSRIVDALSNGPLVIGQSQQSALRVQAVVSPNPNATLLYYNTPTYVINQTAGTTASYTCAYTITVDKTTSSYWNLYDGLSSDFSSSFPGKDLSNNTYVQSATPQPASTPFVVYPDNSNSWYKRASATTPETYCVDLTLTIPSAVPGGAYTTNAVYTIYF